VIDVGVGNENTLNFDSLSWGQGMQITAIEKQGVSAMSYADIKCRIAKRPIQQFGVKNGSQNFYTLVSGNTDDGQPHKKTEPRLAGL
jgi:hypothetical protein